MLTSSHTNTSHIINKDITTGEFKLIDLFSAPYNFSLDPLVAIEDWVFPEPERKMYLWTKEQVSNALVNFNLASNSP